MLFSTLIFYFVIWADINLLKRRDRESFRRVFAWHWGLLAGLMATVIVMAWAVVDERRSEELPGALMVLVLFVYLAARIRFNGMSAVPAPEPPAAPSKLLLASNTCGVVLQWFAGMFVFGLVVRGLSSLSPVLDTMLGQTVEMALFSSVFMLGLVYVMVRRARVLDYARVLGLKGNKLPWTRVWLWPSLLGVCCAYVSSLVIVSRTNQPSTPFTEMLSSTTSSWLLLAFFVLAVFLVPFLEEVIFRGFFFFVIERLKGKGVAIVVIATVFAAMHVDQYWGDWAAIAAVTVLGFVLTFLRAWTGSSVPGIVTHYFFNGGMTVIPLILILLANPIYFEYETRYDQLSDVQKEGLLLESIRDYPRHAPSYNDLAWLYAQQNENLDRALELADKALALDPDQYAYLDTKAEVLYRLGHVAGAVRIEERLVERYPHLQQARDQLDKFRAALGKEN